jgi:hypothetical protein
MPQAIRLWEIESEDRLREIQRHRLDLEERIETWLADDISLISSDLLVVGRQVETDFGGAIDLLCLDYTGDLVIVELKREKTPREVTAQVLDYASWARELSNERITEVAARYFADGTSLEDAFKRRFGEELPEILNEYHKMLIVASDVDSSTERIIHYLSDTYGVAINFRDQDGKEFLARTFLIEPSEVEYKAQTKVSSKRKPPLTYEELQAIAERNDVGELYKRLVDGLTPCFDQRGTTRSTVAFIGIIEGSRNTIFSIVPGASDSAQGVRFSVYIERLSKYLGVERDNIVPILPPEFEEGEAWKGGPPTLCGFFKDAEEVEKFLSGLARFKSFV